MTQINVTLTQHEILWTLRAIETARKAIIVVDDATRALAQTYDMLIVRYGGLLIRNFDNSDHTPLFARKFVRKQAD